MTRSFTNLSDAIFGVLTVGAIAVGVVAASVPARAQPSQTQPTATGTASAGVVLQPGADQRRALPRRECPALQRYLRLVGWSSHARWSRVRTGRRRVQREQQGRLRPWTGRLARRRRQDPVRRAMLAVGS